MHPAETTLGLIGGLGLPAGIHYYRQLARTLDALPNPTPLLIAHAHMPTALRHVQSGDLDALAAYFAGLFRRLASAGATLAAIPAITPHICAAQLAAVTPIPFVNILDAIAVEVRRRAYKRIALLGTRYTLETRLFGALTGVEIHTPPPAEIDTIHNAYYAIANETGDPNDHRATLARIAHELLRRESLDAILLAGTDLSLVFHAANTDFPHLDCAAVHLAAIELALYPDKAVPTASLYEQVGGEATLRSAIKLFYRKVFQDPALLPFFEDVDRERLEAHQFAFITQALGGPDSYDGRSLRDAHLGHQIEQRHFDILTLHMEVAFLEMGLNEELVNEALATIRALAADIVNTK